MNSRPTVYEIAPALEHLDDAQPPVENVATFGGNSNGLQVRNGSRVVHIELHLDNDAEELRALLALQRDLSQTVDSFDSLERALKFDLQA